MNIIKGDLIQLALDGTFDVIIHGCNCQCTMGAGIAKTIRSVFPEAYEADCATEKGDRSKLGSISFTEVNRDNHSITIVNGYTQFHWRGTGGLVDYDAVRSVMKEVCNRFSGKRIGYPLIGAGLAGGNWSIISNIIDEELGAEYHTLVKFGL